MDQRARGSSFLPGTECPGGCTPPLASGLREQWTACPRWGLETLVGGLKFHCFCPNIIPSSFQREHCSSLLLWCQNSGQLPEKNQFINKENNLASMKNITPLIYRLSVNRNEKVENSGKENNTSKEESNRSLFKKCFHSEAQCGLYDLVQKPF